MIVRDTVGARSGLCVYLLIGTPVEVVSLRWNDPLFGPVWNIKTSLSCPQCDFRYAAMLDADLQPLRGDSRKTDTETPKELEHES